MSHKNEARVSLLADDGSDQEMHSPPNSIRVRAPVSKPQEYNMKSSAFIVTLIGLAVCVTFLFLFLALPMFAPSSKVWEKGSGHEGMHADTSSGHGGHNDGAGHEMPASPTSSSSPQSSSSTTSASHNDMGEMGGMPHDQGKK